jgi:hypothetical protein
MRTELFKQKTKNFIETGSYIGIGIDLAIRSGFENIFSIEIQQHFYEKCLDKFKHNTNVNLILGDSFFELEKLLNQYPDTPFTYWLDGHYSGGNTGKGVKETPLLRELEVILSRGIDGELIYVDDMRIYRTFDDEVNSNSIKELIKKYKPNATLWYESSPHDPQDCLCIEY